MSITYTWKITGVKKLPTLGELSNVITHINFDYTGSIGSGEDKKESTFHGTCPIGSPDAENFVEIDKLTEEDVINWAKAHHSVVGMNKVISEKLGEPIYVEVTSSELPWLSGE